MSEDQLQSQCFQWVWNYHPELRGLIFSVPNGGTRNKIEAMKLKATGLTPGIPDLILLHNGTAIGIELKTETGTISPAQKNIHAIWEAAGYRVVVIRDFNFFCHFIESL